MVNWLLKIIVPSKVTDVFSTAKNFLSGKKTYIGGAVLMLQATAMLVEQFTQLNGLADLLSWAKGMGTNEAVMQFSAALGIMGLRAGISKTKLNKKQAE